MDFLLTLRLAGFQSQVSLYAKQMWASRSRAELFFRDSSRGVIAFDVGINESIQRATTHWAIKTRHVREKSQHHFLSCLYMEHVAFERAGNASKVPGKFSSCCSFFAICKAYWKLGNWLLRFPQTHDQQTLQKKFFLIHMTFGMALLVWHSFSSVDFSGLKTMSDEVIVEMTWRKNTRPTWSSWRWESLLKSW